MYKLFLCLRYLRKRRIAFFAVGAVCLCVAMVLIVVSVMGGFLQMVKDRSRGMLGDLIIENSTLQGFPYYQEFIDDLYKKMPEQIEEATPVIVSYGVIRFPSLQRIHPTQIVGIRLGETYRVNDFKKGLFYEKYYPGTTTFADQKLPLFGRDEAGHVLLPPEFESAYQRWAATAPAEEMAKVPIAKDLDYQRPGNFGPNADEVTDKLAEPAWKSKSLPGVIVGTDLCARRLKSGEYERYYMRGEPAEVMLVPMTVAGHLSDATGPRKGIFRYIDDSRTGVYDIDSMSIYVDFDTVQRILEMTPKQMSEEDGGYISPARSTQIQIKLKPGVNPEMARDRIAHEWEEFASARMDALADKPELRSSIHRLLDWVTVQTWEEKQARFIAAVEKEKYLVTVLFGVISVVAVFLVGCIFYMIVQQKTRDIGIVKSVGATSLGVAGIFLAYGAAVGVVGGAMGTILGTVFVWYINNIQDFLAWINPGLQIWSAEVYAFDRIPNEVNRSEAIVIYICAIVASMIGSVIAAYRAARVWPVEALRYE